MSNPDDFEVQDSEVTLLCSAEFAEEFSTNLRKLLGDNVAVVLENSTSRLRGHEIPPL